MSDWGCAKCNGIVSDTTTEREQLRGSQYCKGETAFCIECSDIIYDRSTLPIVTMIPGLIEPVKPKKKEVSEDDWWH